MVQSCGQERVVHRGAERHEAVRCTVSRGTHDMGNDPKSTPLSRRQAAIAAKVHGATVHSGYLESTSAPQEAVAAEVARALLPFLTRDDGWLRISPTNDGETVYFKWKWTAGPYANHYVMAVYPAHEADQALALLARKMHAVDSREQKPVRDHYFH